MLNWTLSLIALAMLLVTSIASAQELSGVGTHHDAVSPADMDARREDSAREMSSEYPGATINRIALVDIAWPTEGESTGGYAILLLDATTHVADELPIRRAYIRGNDGVEVELRRIGAQRFTLSNASQAYAVFGPFQESSFYWAPTEALVSPGALLIDFATNRTGFRAMEFPVEGPAWYRRSPAAAPDADALAALLAREYAGFAPR